jgi:hypothetical protein
VAWFVERGNEPFSSIKAEVLRTEDQDFPRFPSTIWQDEMHRVHLLVLKCRARCLVSATGPNVTEACHFHDNRNTMWGPNDSLNSHVLRPVCHMCRDWSRCRFLHERFRGTLAEPPFVRRLSSHQILTSTVFFVVTRLGYVCKSNSVFDLTFELIQIVIYSCSFVSMLLIFKELRVELRSERAVST